MHADIVVAPHHGSVRTTEADFLQSLDPDIVIHSCGRNEYETQQQTEHDQSARHFYTPENGAITIRIRKDGSVRIETTAR